jgi:hypothetical protein
MELNIYLNGHLMVEHVKIDKKYHEMACSDLTYKRLSTFEYELRSRTNELIAKSICLNDKIHQRIRGYNLSRCNTFGFIPDKELLLALSYRFNNNQPDIRIR